MLLQCLSFGCQVSTVSLILAGGNAEAFDFTSHAEQLVLFLFKTDLGISKLN